MNDIIKGNCDATLELKELVEMVSPSISTSFYYVVKPVVEKTLLQGNFI